MKTLDLTQTEDIIYLAKNYNKYKATIQLPGSLMDDIELEFHLYDEMQITYNEVQNRIIDLVLEFIKSLDFLFNK